MLAFSACSALRDLKEFLVQNGSNHKELLEGLDRTYDLITNTIFKEIEDGK